jgi:uncharacterized membrane protein YcaP (DUF421 family)
MFFESWTALGRVVVISACAYAALILILRISGKRTLGKLNAFDLAVTVAIGSTLATVLLSKDVALAEGLVAFAMVVALQWVVTSASVRWPGFKRLARSEPTLLVEQGHYLDAAIAAERLTRSEVDQAIRNKGIGRIGQVAAVVLETDGSFSVIATDDSDGELTALRSIGPRRGEPGKPGSTDR